MIKLTLHRSKVHIWVNPRHITKVVANLTYTTEGTHFPLVEETGEKACTIISVLALPTEAFQVSGNELEVQESPEAVVEAIEEYFRHHASPDAQRS